MNEMHEDKLSRRDFTRHAALGATALAGFSILNQAHAKATPLKIGLIGSGGRGTGAVQDAIQASDQVTLVAVADVFEDRVKGAVKSLKDNAELSDNIQVNDDCIFWGFDAYKKLLEIKDIDYVILATPPGFRPIHFEAVVKAKKHCFCEKPVGTDPTGIRRYMAAAKQSVKDKLSVVAGTQRRHQKPYVETIKKIHDGALGEILSGRAYWDGGLPWVHDRKPEWSDLEYQLRNWYGFCWICGDNIVEQHVHNLDIMNWVLKAHPISVIASGGRAWKPNEEKYGNIWDSFSCDFEYPNGIHVYSFCRHWNKSYDEVSEQVIGTKRDTSSKGISSCSDMGEGGLNPYVQEHIDLQASITGDGPYLNEAMQVAESTFTAIVGRMAAYTGQKLEWEKALNSDLDIFPKKLSFDEPLPYDPIPVPPGNI